jgi:hypothetical protein
VAEFHQKFYQALSLRDFDPTAAVEGMTAASRMAREAGNLTAVIYMDHWILQILIFTLKDFSRAYDLAVKTALEARKPIYQQMMERVCVHEDLIFTYIGIDPVGYSKLIEDAIDYMDREISDSSECRYCLLEARSTFELSCGRLDKARPAVQRYISSTESRSPHHFGIAHAKMCEYLYAAGEWENLLYYAQQGREALGDQHPEYMALVLAAQALARRKLGNDGEAQTMYRLATAKAATIKGAMHHVYYDLLCDFHLSVGNIQQAIQLRERQLHELTNKGQPFWEALTRLKVIRLLKQTGKTYTAEVERIRQLAATLKQPDVILSQLATLTTE